MVHSVVSAWNACKGRFDSLGSDCFRCIASLEVKPKPDFSPHVPLRARSLKLASPVCLVPSLEKTILHRARADFAGRAWQ